MKILKYQLRYALPLWLVQFACAWLPDNRYSISIRGKLASYILPAQPKFFQLGRDVTLLNIDRLDIGSNVYFAKGCWVNAVGGISIASEVIISPYVVMSSSKHTFKNGSVKQGGSFFSPIKIGSGTWISSHSTIAAGAVIGSGVLVGANSLVVSSVDNDKVVLGVPIAVIKDRVDRPGEAHYAR